MTSGCILVPPKLPIHRFVHLLLSVTMRSWLFVFPLAAMASTEILLKPRQAGEFCSSWRPCTEGGQATQLTTYCRSILSMSDQTSTITAYDSRTTESRTITTSVAATTTFYGTTVTTTSTVTEPTSTAYVYTSTATTASTSTVTVTPTVTTTMTTQAPDATSVISQCLAPGLKQQDKRDLVEDHGLIKRQSPSSSVPIPNCFLRSYSTTLGDGRSTVTTSTAGKSEQSAVCTSCASVTPFTSTTTTRVTTPTTIRSTSTMSVITRTMTVTSGTSTSRVSTVVYRTTVTEK
ncbi:unnamed protein product [Cercospora beticola]|nr:unnamed protein product [Cercospora beticola]